MEYTGKNFAHPQGVIKLDFKKTEKNNNICVSFNNGHGVQAEIHHFIFKHV